MAFKNLRKEQFIHSNFPFIRYSLDYTLNSLKKIGAQKLEWYGAHPHLNLYDTTYADMKVLKQKLDDHGLSVVEINPENCAYPNNLASKDPAVRLRSFRFYENAIRTAGVLGTPYVLVFPGYAAMDETNDQVWDLTVDAMRRLADIAKTEGVTITYEATTRNLTVINDHKDIMRLIKDCGSDNMAVTIDMMCLSQTMETVDDVYAICGAEKIVNVHYTDGGLLPNGSWEHRIPGEGELDMECILKMFDENNYKGYFGNEVVFTIDSTIKTPEEVCQKLQNWWEKHF